MRYILFLLPLLILASCSSEKEQPPPRQTVRLTLFDDPVSLDPRLVRTTKDLTVVKQLFDGLFRTDKAGKLQPALAKSYAISDDLLTYTFYLRKAFWSNGDPVTAHDFADAWVKVLDPTFASDYAYMLYPIKNARLARSGECPPEAVGIEVLDELTLTVRLEAPTPYFLELLTFPTFFPVNHKIDYQEKNWAVFVSNGPFKLKSWEPQRVLTLVKNRRYWDKNAVRLKALVFTVLDDNNTESQLFDKEKLDWLGLPTSRNLPADQVKVREAESFDVAGTYWLKFNTDQPPFDRPKLRRAFSYAINRQQIIEHILQGTQALATGPIPPSMRLQENPYFEDGNRAGAKKLFEEVLAENGWTRDAMPKITLSYSASERNSKIVQLIQQQWREAFNIEVALNAYELHHYRSILRQGGFQVGSGEWIADYHDPLAFLELFKLEESGWHNSEFADLLDRSLIERDEGRRRELLHKAEKILVDEMPIAPVYHYTFDYVKKSYVKDVVLSPLGTADFKFSTTE